MRKILDILKNIRAVCACVIIFLACSKFSYSTTRYADLQSPGWNAIDATACLQNAIAASNKGDVVVVKNMGSPWYVTPVKVNKSITVQFNTGVLVMAKSGAFTGSHDSLFLIANNNGANLSGVTLTGYGAALRMRKTDYLNRTLYAFSEWRMGIYVYNCSNLTIEGLTIEDTGGDGIMLMSDYVTPCSSITIKDVTCDNNYRQGMSIIDVNGLTVTNCVFKNTSGTAPSAGVDFEPDNKAQILKGIVFDNCTFQDNHGSGIEISLGQLTGNPTVPVDITIKNSKVIGGEVVAVLVNGIKSDGPTGSIKFDACTFEGSFLGAIDIMCKSKDKASVDFNNCVINLCGRGTHPNYNDPSYTANDGTLHQSLWTNTRWSGQGGSLTYPTSPVSFDDYGGDPALGGVTFRNCYIVDDKNRAAVKAIRLEAGLTNVSGVFRYFNAVNPTPTTDFSGFTPITNVNITYNNAQPATCFEKHLLGVDAVRSDLSGDCTIDFLDFALLASQWGAVQ